VIAMRARRRPRHSSGPSRRLAVLVTGVALVATPVIAISTSSAEASTSYVVAPSGSDSGDGTVASPWRTLAASFKRLHAGDTLVVRGGTYAEQVRVTVPKGTASAPIRVVAAKGERPVVSGLLWLKDADYWTLDGVNVTWSSKNTSTQHMVKMNGGIGWRITGAEIWGAHSYAAILVSGTPSKWSIDHSYIHDTYASNDTNQDHLIYVNGGMGGGVIERNVLAHSANGRGVKVGPPSGSSAKIGNVTIRYNAFYDNRGPSNIQLSYGASNVTIYRNLMDISGSGKPNITAYRLNGSGNVAYGNIGWRGKGVLSDAAGLADGGGNISADPHLGADGYPTSVSAAGYGPTAP
jgi:hypothetical protein